MKKFKITKRGNIQITMDKQTFRNLDGILSRETKDVLLINLWVNFGEINDALDES